MIQRTIPAATHGRYLVQPPSAATPAPVLVGCHGYAERADDMMRRLQAIDGADRWLLVSVQGLNRFYQRRTDDVIAGWMTREDRELAIVDNIAYVNAVVESVVREWNAARGVVFAGFSQGVAMAFRAAAASPCDVRGVVAAGGDVPPELDGTTLRRVNAALMCRGAGDLWYTTEKHRKDLERLSAAGVHTVPVEFDGGHEWSAAVLTAAAEFLAPLR